MTRLPYADPDRLPQKAREALEAVPPLGVFLLARVMATTELDLDEPLDPRR